MTEKPHPTLFPVQRSDDELTLAERRTPELILAFVGPIGSGVSKTAEIFAEILENEFKYNRCSHKMSAIITENARLVGSDYNESTGADRIQILQTIGNNLRKRFGPDYISKKVIEAIARFRVERGYDKTSDAYLALPMRHVHIIDSLKNPDEAKLLRDVYGDTFWLIGVFAPADVRKDRLKGDGVKETELQSVINRDEKESFLYGQNVRDTIFEADFFIRNDAQNDDELKKRVRRFLDILFNITVNTPTVDEAAMYTAVSSAAKSACMSRQVGAAIYSKDGELIGVGSNDVPKFGGGLYKHEDNNEDHRCYKWKGKKCHNDDRKNKLYQSITDILLENKLVKKNNIKDVQSILKTTEIKNLIEYSRAVHAEMEAIISVARSGKKGIIGATLYCTTFPCHSCARHIVASGIARVVYIEPYPKSLAEELHKDSVTARENVESKFVRFVQYDGVAPKNIIRFFRHGIDRKKDGKIVTRDRHNADPLHQPLLDGFATREQIVVTKLAAIEASNSENKEI